MTDTAAQRLTTPANSTSDRQLGTARPVSLRTLLWLYLTIPLTSVVVVVDQVLLSGLVRDSLRTLPEEYLLLALVFGTPHIVASNLILFTNPDYLRHYWLKIVQVSAAILVTFALFGWWVPRSLFVVAIVGWTVHHVLKQQLGVGNIASRLSGNLFRGWSWLGIGVGTLFYSAVLLEPGPNELALIRQLVFAGAVAVGLLSTLLWTQTSDLGRLWLVANTLMMFGSGAMFALGYPLFAVLIPRLAHDATAYAFYINHEANRQTQGRMAVVHWPLKRMLGSWPAVLLLPALSLLMAAFLHYVADGWLNAVLSHAFGVTIDAPISFGFVGFLGLLHYAFESFTWKGSSPYRQYVSISTGK